MKPFSFNIDMTPETAFSAVQALPWSLWLDSADRAHPHARYSFITTNPIETIEARGGKIFIENSEGKMTLAGDPFAILMERLAAQGFSHETIPGLPPFQGGLAGFFGYDMARSIEKIPSRLAENSGMPDMALGIYDAVLAFDHLLKKSWAIVWAENEREAKKKKENILPVSPHQTPAFQSGPIEWKTTISKTDYLRHVQNTIDYIHAGDVFQVNLSQRFEAKIPKNFDPFSHYMHLRAVNPAPFAAYMNLGNIKISSASPEQFLTVQNNIVSTRPIKGTRPRERNPAELLNSTKDRAENIMIVDLLRSDLSKVCEAGSIEVEELCRLETFASVYHLVSTISGKLREGKTALDLLRGCFPGGSITGAPKIRSMHIIEEMETSRRGPYCGAIAYIGFNGAMDSSILIRTLVYQNNTVSMNAGGGITADSDPTAEYQETLDKAAKILESYNTQSLPITKREIKHS